MPITRSWTILACTCLVFVVQLSRSQAQGRVLSIREALKLAENNQPQLAASRDQARATGYNVDLAKNTLVPDLSVGYQADYFTFNNVNGTYYSGLLMPMEGPAQAVNRDLSVPTSALAALLKWEPFTFGQRAAAEGQAAAQFRLANAHYDEQLFLQQFAVITAYMEAVYLKGVAMALQAGVARADAALEQSLVLARQGLRAGVDTVQFQSLSAQAEMDYFGAQKLYDAQVLELTRLTGIPEGADSVVLSDTLLATRVPAWTDTARSFTNSPTYRLYADQKALSQANLQQVERAWRPTLDLWANAYARGSGVQYNGVVMDGQAWNLDRFNYGLGFQLSFPILQFTGVHLRKQQYRYLLKADEERLSQVAINLEKQIQVARSNLRTSELQAGYAPSLLKAASDAYRGLQLSYRSGLIDFTRLTAAQFQLLQAEVAGTNVRIQSWKDLLELAVARGDLTLFTDQIQ
jgi:outer membrane protein TolC